MRATGSDDSAEVAELNFLLNGGTPSARSDRAKKQEEMKKVLPPPTANELRGMSVQAAVEALIEHVNVDSVVMGCCDRWQALGYGPGRRQSAADAGALPAIVAGMQAHAAKPRVQEKACLAIANICSGTDENGLARKALAFDAGVVTASVAALLAHAEDAAVAATAAAAIGNVCYAGDASGLQRKHAAYEAGAIAPIAAALARFGDDATVCENSCFALGNLCRALGKVGSAGGGGGGGGDGGGAAVAPELAPIDEQLRQKEEGATRKQAAADAGALEGIVAAMRRHEDNKGIQDWGSRALSIITYESTPLRERAKTAGAKMQWLMGLTESMDAAKASTAVPMSKTGRPVRIPSSGRIERAVPRSVRGR